MFEKYDAYKDSGVDWLGEIPKNWQVKKLKHIASMKSGDGITNSQLLNNGLYEVYGGNGFIGYTNKFNCSGKTIVIGRVGALCGNVRYIKENKYISDNALILKAYNDQNYDFIALILQSANLNKLSTSNAQPLITATKVMNLGIPVPNTLEQEMIVNFLDQKTSEIDQAIAIKEQQIALLNERKQIVIQKAVTQGLDPNVPMKDSGVEWIGQIPEHWECKPSRYAFRAVKRFKRDGTEIKFSVTQKWGVIPTDEMQESATQAVSFDGFQICLEDDLVLNKYKAHLGVFWRAPSRGLITGNYTVFEPLKGINSKYFELLYHTPVYIDIFRTIVYGVIEGMMPLYNNDFYDMLSIVPPLEEQLAIVQYVEEQQKEFSKIERVFLGQSEKLKEYKTTLINDAVTGKIKVA